MGSSLFINAIPYYLLALLSQLFLISQWGIFPESGYFSPFSDGPLAWVKGLLLAWIVLALAYATAYARFSRGSMIESMNEDYVRTARAKGLDERRVTLKHGLRAPIVPMVAIFGLDFAFLLAARSSPRIFNIEGVGLAARGHLRRDLPVSPRPC